MVGLMILVAANGAIHEIEAFLLFLIAAVLIVGSAIIAAIRKAEKRVAELIQPKAVSMPAPKPKANTKPPPMPAKRVEIPGYFYSSDGVDAGPYNVEQMRQFRRDGKIADEMLVCRDGDGEWRLASEFSELGV